MSVTINPRLGTDSSASGQEPIYNVGTNVPVATDRDGIGVAQQRTGAGNLTMTGAGVAGGVYTAGFDGGRKITVYSTGNLSALTFTITGTDKDGAAQTNDITGPNNGTTTGTKYFQTVTQVAVGATVGTNVEIGFSASLVVFDPSKRGTYFQFAPLAGETVLMAFYGGNSSAKQRLAIKMTNPGAATMTWADGTTPTDTRVYFAGGVEPTLTASGTDLFEFLYDGSTASSDSVWFCITQIADLKP